MIPVFAIFGSYLLPDTLAFVDPFIFNPYFCLLLGLGLTYIPFGVLLVIKMTKSSNLDNVNPRKATQTLAATNPMAARSMAAHNNMLEGYSFFAAAVLAALQAGVAPAVVSQFATLWVFARSAYVAIYILQTNNAVASLRSLCFVTALLLQSKLFYLAAGK